MPDEEIATPSNPVVFSEPSEERPLEEEPVPYVPPPRPEPHPLDKIKADLTVQHADLHDRVGALQAAMIALIAHIKGDL
jgi:hypothetical protein